MLALGKRGDICLHRQNTGVAKDQRTGQLVRFGTPGQGDLTGMLTVGGLGIHLELEVKTSTGRQSEVQIQYQHMVERHGGVYLLCRSVADAVQGIDQAIARIAQCLKQP